MNNMRERPIDESRVKRMLAAMLDYQTAQRYAAQAPSLPHDQPRTELRMYAGVVAAMLTLLMAEPALYLSAVPDSVFAKVIAISRLSFKSMVVIHVGLISLTLPHLAILCFFPRRMDETWPRALASGAAFINACLWLYATALSLPLDYGSVWLAYIVRAGILASVAYLLAWSVNAQHLRDAAAAAR